MAVLQFPLPVVVHDLNVEEAQVNNSIVAVVAVVVVVVVGVDLSALAGRIWVVELLGRIRKSRRHMIVVDVVVGHIDDACSKGHVQFAGVNCFALGMMCHQYNYDDGGGDGGFLCRDLNLIFS